MHSLIAPEDLPWFYGGLCSCRHPSGCIPYPITSSYTDPRRDKDGYYSSGRIAGERQQVYDHPIAITSAELRRHQQRQGKPCKLEWAWVLDRGSAVSFSVLYCPRYDPTVLNNTGSHVALGLSTIKPATQIRQREVVSTGSVDVTEFGLYILRWAPVDVKANVEVRFKLL